MAKEQGIDVLKTQILKLAPEILRKYAQTYHVEAEKLENWCADIEKHLKEFAQNLAKVKERMQETKELNNQMTFSSKNKKQYGFSK